MTFGTAIFVFWVTLYLSIQHLYFLYGGLDNFFGGLDRMSTHSVCVSTVFVSVCTVFISVSTVFISVSTVFVIVSTVFVSMFKLSPNLAQGSLNSSSDIRLTLISLSKTRPSTLPKLALLDSFEFA